jgi:hypothetical protein
MSQEEARLLLDAWNYFDSHPDKQYWEGLPGITRDQFYRLMPVITGIESLVEAKIYVGQIAQGTISATVPGTIIEAAQAENLPAPYVEDAKRATALVRSWIKSIKPKTAEDVATREVAAAQVKAELARIEEKREKAPVEKKVEIPEVPTEKIAPAAPPSEETASIGIKITPAAAGAFQKLSARVATLPIRAAIEWSRPTLAKEEPVRTAALTLWARGISGAQLEEKAKTLEAKDQQKLEKLIKAIKGEEQTFFYETALLKQAFPVDKITFLLGPESGVTQAQVALFFAPAEEEGISAVPRRSFFGNMLSEAGSQVFGKVSSKFLKAATKKAAAKLGVKIAAEAAVTAPAIAAGPPGWLARAALWLATEIGGKVLGFIKNNFKEIVGASLVAAGIFIGGTTGTVMAAGGTGVFVGGKGLKSAANSIGQFSSALFSGALFPALGIPLLISLIAVPIVVAIILFIINSGAYIVPPQVSTTGILESPYIGVEKTATPDCLNRTEPEEDCGSLPGAVTYRVTITARRGTLTNIEIENSYQIFGRGSGDISAPEIPIPNRISPSAPFTYSYTLNFGSNLNDSVIYDTLTVTADSPEQEGAEASGVASVIIGNPPASSCPILGGAISTGSYNGERETGHGSNLYWTGPAGTDCGYDIPAFSGCNSPTESADPDGNNVCRGRARSCPYYGFAADVRRSGAGDIVQLPSIFGQSITWTFQRRVSIAGGSWGYGYVFTGNSSRGNYSLYLGHLNQTTPPATAPSGTVIGSLYPGLTPPHVHIELQINGQWVRPDFLCGGPGP